MISPRRSHVATALPDGMSSTRKAGTWAIGTTCAVQPDGMGDVVRVRKRLDDVDRPYVMKPDLCDPAYLRRKALGQKLGIDGDVRRSDAEIRG